MVAPLGGRQFCVFNGVFLSSHHKQKIKYREGQGEGRRLLLGIDFFILGGGIHLLYRQTGMCVFLFHQNIYFYLYFNQLDKSATITDLTKIYRKAERRRPGKEATDPSAQLRPTWHQQEGKLYRSCFNKCLLFETEEQAFLDLSLEH